MWASRSLTRKPVHLWLFAAGVGVLVGGLAMFAAGGWPGAYRAGETARFDGRVAASSAPHLRVEKIRGPLFRWVHAQYLPPGEVLEVPLAPGPLSLRINFWDPGLYRVVITGSPDQVVRVGLPAARFWGSVALAVLVWTLGVLAGWTSARLPRPRGLAAEGGNPSRARWRAMSAGFLVAVSVGTGAARADSTPAAGGVSPAREVSVIVLDAPASGGAGTRGESLWLGIHHPENGVLLSAPVRSGSTLRYRFPEGARYRVSLGEVHWWLEVPPVPPAGWETARGLAVLVAFFLGGGLAGLGLGRLRRATGGEGCG
ncbi:hypothetical protein [Caldinitratiruptor microaerophilus]|uniref:Uncharacterized protein n=1 Tax=Caldinitratiruptor microaerophilus TaxID=671077 RepID=A0AA35G9K5_9FIRM|nr:hypothetical protein [Caldinitratiruptor microaerophilus]BDG61563.1 hypothetical protein caldi_26530 [Caldinitratiruptor microaerophilus]